MDPLTIGMLVILAVLIFFMFRNSKKRKAEQEEMRAKMVPGAEVMTNFGLFGTILSIDEDDNKVELQAGEGTVLTLHRQAIARVVEAEETVEEEPVADDVEEASADDDNKNDNA